MSLRQKLGKIAAATPGYLKFRQRWENPSGKTKPVFLIGCGRSGTSMVLGQLSKSFKIHIFDEHPDNEIYYRSRIRSIHIIRDTIKNTDAKIALFKPILDTAMAPELMREFPEAKFIFIYRHYQDVINSTYRKFGHQFQLREQWSRDDYESYFPNQLPPETTRKYITALTEKCELDASVSAIYWLLFNRLYFDLGLHNRENVYLLKYEDLVTNPEVVFESLVSFCGIAISERIETGVSKSSVRKNEPMKLDPAVEAECQKLLRDLDACKSS